MRIAQIIYPGFGGHGSVAFSLVEAGRDGHQWRLGFLGNTAVDPSYVARCQVNGIMWEVFRSRTRRPFLAWFKLYRWFCQMRPDAILLHSINAIIPAYLYAMGSAVALIAVEHTALPVKSRFERLASRLAMCLADRVVVLSDGYGRSLAASQGKAFNPAKLRVIPNGIDINRFAPPEPSGRPDEKCFRIGMSGRFVRGKRFDLAIDALAALRASHPRVNWLLSLAGEGEMLAEAQHHASRLGLGNHVTFAGMLREPDMINWLQHLDAFVLASDAETQSTSLLQAMSVGLPCVASAIQGNQDVLGNNGTYGLLAVNTPEEFAAALADLARDPRRRQRLGQDARQHCIAHFSQHRMYESYMALVGEVRQERL